MQQRMTVRPAVLLVFLSACTEVDLYEPLLQPPPEPEKKPNVLTGSFCTEDPKTVTFPVRVWFVIDDSGSMQQNDPNRKRYTAVKDLATKLAAPGTMYFGGEVFSGQRTRVFSTPRFTDDVPAFNAQVDAVSGAGNGDTPYLGALNLATGELTADITEHAATATNTRYVIVFLSDGNPTDSQEPQILAAVDTLMGLKSRVAGITLNTVYLGGGGGNAQQILTGMAMRGEGKFKSFPNGDALDYSGFDFSAIRRTFVHRFFMVTNRTMLPTGDLQLPDSDLDGLSDDAEAKLGTDPTKRDTDGDGCQDLMETRVGWDPLVKGSVNKQCTCMNGDDLKDTDGDGLSDCEEKWIGTHFDDADSDIGKDSPTDGDLVPDGLDYLYLNDATFPNTSADRDLDGHLDIQELAVHTAPAVNDRQRDLTALVYSKFEQRKDEPRCFDFQVDNLILGHTKATAEHGVDENVVELYVAQSSQDDPHKNRMFRVARKKVPWAEFGVTVRVDATDFTQVMHSK